MSVTKQDYFCAAPWTGLYIDPSGRVDNCCISKNDIGNVNEHHVNDIVAGTRNLAVKQDMLANLRVKGCDSCFRNDPSHRFQNFWNTEYTQLGDDYFANTDNFSLKYLDLRWNNTCNYACIYCGAGCSSLWADIETKKDANTIDIIPVDQKTTRSRQSLLDYVIANVSEIEHIYLAGGEPLMLKENVQVMDAVLAAGSQCRIVVNTNLSRLEGNAVFERLKQHRNVQWLISGETSHEQYEYIRWPGVWSDFHRNLGIINDLRDRGHTMSFNFVVMNLNALSVWDFVDLLGKDFGVDQRSITANLYNMRDSTGEFAIQRLPQALRDLARQRAQGYRVLGVDNFLDALNDPMPEYRPGLFGLEITVERLAELDRDRGLESRKIFKHLYDYVDGAIK